MPFNVSCITLEYEYDLLIDSFLTLSGKEKQNSIIYRRMVFKTKWEHQWPGDARQTASEELDSQYDFQNWITQLYIYEAHIFTTALRYHFQGIFENYT